MHQTKISFFINGLEADNTAFDVQTLSGSVTDFASGAMRIGQSLNGKILPTENYLFDYIITVKKSYFKNFSTYTWKYGCKYNFSKMKLLKAFCEPSKNKYFILLLYILYTTFQVNMPSHPI